VAYWTRASLAYVAPATVSGQKFFRTMADVSLFMFIGTAKYRV